MAPKSMLMSKLNTLMMPAPSQDDPEDNDGWDGASAVRLKPDIDSDEDVPESFLPTKLRADADMNASEWGEKYSSKKVNRKDIKNYFPSEDEDEDDNEYDVEEDEVDDDDEEDDEGDKLEEEEEDEEEDSDDDDDDEEEEDDDAEYSEDDDAGRKTSKKSQQSPFVGVGVDDELEQLENQDKANKLTKNVSMGQQERAVHAKALIKDYDTVLELRIALQQVMSVVNKCCISSDEEYYEDRDRVTASHQMQCVIQRLCTLREDMRCSHGSTTKRSDLLINNLNKKRNDKEAEKDMSKKESCVFDGKANDVLLGDDVHWSGEEEGYSRKKKLVGVWGAIDQGFKKSQPFWENTLEIWQRRAQIGGAAVSKHKFKVVNRNVFDQSAAALLDRPRALKRAHPMISDTQNNEEDDDDNADDDVENKSSKNKKLNVKSRLDTSTFDDTSFYHSLLKDFLESHSTSEDHAQMAIAAAAKKRRTKHNGVDTRSTKGRKIRYEPLPKLENFMFPSNAYAPPLNVDDLFNSLFGSRTTQ